MSETLYTTSLSDQDLSGDKGDDCQSKLSAILACGLPCGCLSVNQCQKGIPQVTNKNLMKKSWLSRRGVITAGNLTLQACENENVRLCWNKDEKTMTLPDCRRAAQIGAGST